MQKNIPIIVARLSMTHSSSNACYNLPNHVKKLCNHLLFENLSSTGIKLKNQSVIYNIHQISRTSLSLLFRAISWTISVPNHNLYPKFSLLLLAGLLLSIVFHLCVLPEKQSSNVKRFLLFMVLYIYFNKLV